MSDIDFNILPSDHFGNLYKKVRQLYHVLIKIKEFSARIHNAVDEREGILVQFYQAYGELMPHVIGAINISRLVNPKGADSYISELKSKTYEVNGMLIEFKKKIDEASIAVSEVTRKEGASRYAEIFEKESQEFAKSATLWLSCVVGLVITTLAAGMVLLLVQKDGGFGFDDVQFTITKIVIISALFYSVSLCIKNYRAQKHNEVLNRHRHNALKTFETFTAASDDIQTKNAVLLEATRTIFGNQSTGYSSSDVSESDGPSRFIEIIKSATPK